MRLSVLFVLLLPFSLLEATVVFLPVSLLVVFSMSLVLSSRSLFVFAFLTGFLFALFSGMMFSLLSFYFLAVAFFGNFCRSTFGKNLLLFSTFFFFLELLFFFITRIPFHPFLIGLGFFFFFPTYYLVDIWLSPLEGRQLQFNFFKPL